MRQKWRIYGLSDICLYERHMGGDQQLLRIVVSKNNPLPVSSSMIQIDYILISRTIHEGKASLSI